MFESVLRLLHPFMPFVTEELWQGMPHEGKGNQAIHFVIAEGLEAYLPLADMVDNIKEVQLLKKHSTKLQADFDSSMKRLSSRNFVEMKAPAAVEQAVRVEQYYL